MLFTAFIYTREGGSIRGADDRDTDDTADKKNNQAPDEMLRDSWYIFHRLSNLGCCANHLLECKGKWQEAAGDSGDSGNESASVTFEDQRCLPHQDLSSSGT